MNIFNLFKYSQIQSKNAGNEIILGVISKDAFFKQFSISFGKLLDPRSLKSEEDVTTQLKSLVQSLHKQIEQTPDNPRYIKPEYFNDKELQREVETVPPQYRETAQQMMQDQEPKEKLVNFLTEAYNKDKKLRLDEWWNYIINQEVYKDVPAFQYIILNYAINSIKKNEKRPPVVLNADAVSQVYEQINQQFQEAKNKEKESGVKQPILAINLEKNYGIALNDAVAKFINSQEKDKGLKEGTYWIKINGQQSDPENFETNVKQLMTLAQGMGWCTAGDTAAKKYLEGGDLWVLIVDGKVHTGMPMEGSNEIKEIDGVNNSIPYDQWEEITDFVDKNKFIKNETYNELAKAVQFNKDIDEGKININSLNIEQYNLLSKAKKKSLTDENYSNIVGNIKKQIERDYFYITDLPKDLINKIGIDNYVQLWITAIEKDFRYIKQFPNDLIDNPNMTIDNYVQLWIKAIKRDLDYIAKFPKNLIGKIGVDNYVQLWITAIEIDSHHITEFPTDLIDNPNMTIDNYVKYWTKTIKGNPYYITYFPNDLIEKITVDNYVQLWIKAIEKGPSYITYFPNDLIDKVGINNYVQLWIKAIEGNTSYITEFPKDLIDKMGVDNYVQLWITAIEIDSHHITEFPTDLIDNPNMTIDNYVKYWIISIEKKSYFIQYFPKNLIDNPNMTIDNYVKLWTKAIEENPYNITHFPKDVLTRYNLEIKGNQIIKKQEQTNAPEYMTQENNIQKEIKNAVQAVNWYKFYKIN